MIDNNSLANKVKDNRQQFETINKILSTESDPKALQELIDGLNNEARQLYLDLQGKMNVSQTELVKRAAFGDKHGYDITKLVDYYEASDMVAGIKSDAALQEILNEKNTGKHKDDYRNQAERLELENLEKQLTDTENPPKDPTAVKNQVRSLRNKMVLPGFAYLNAAKKMKVNVGPITIGSGSSVLTPDWNEGRALELSSPDITISGLKIELKPEAKKKKGK